MTEKLPRLMFDLADGEIIDVGLEYYGEFIANHRTAKELMNGGMTTVDGRPGTLRVVERYANALQLKFVFDDVAVGRVQPQLRRVA